MRGFAHVDSGTSHGWPRKGKGTYLSVLRCFKCQTKLGGGYMICVLVASVSPNSFVPHFIQSSPACWLVSRSDGVCVAAGVLVRPGWSRERSMHKTYPSIFPNCWETWIMLV